RPRGWWHESWRVLPRGQPHPYPRPSTRPVLGAHRSAVLFDHALDDRESQSGPIDLGGEERRKHPRQHVHREPGTSILDADQHPAIVPTAGDGHGPGATHRLNGVLHEVQEDLVELVGAAEDPGAI